MNAWVSETQHCVRAMVAVAVVVSLSLVWPSHEWSFVLSRCDAAVILVSTVDGRMWFEMLQGPLAPGSKTAMVSVRIDQHFDTVSRCVVARLSRWCQSMPQVCVERHMVESAGCAYPGNLSDGTSLHLLSTALVPYEAWDYRQRMSI